MRILKDTVNTLFVTFYIGETPMDADGDVDVVVTDFFDAAILTTVATNETGTGNYSVELPAQSSVKVLRVAWSGTFQGDDQEVIQEYEIVGDFLFSLAELRAQDGLDDDTVYPTSALVTVRDDVTDLINEFTGTAFGETWSYERTRARSNDLILARRPIRSLLSVTDADGILDIDAWYWSSNGIIEATTYVDRDALVQYAYGKVGVPGDLRRAALRLARHWLLSNPSSIPDRARMMTTQWGTYQLTTASEDHPTGLPDVDATLIRYMDPTYKLGFA